MSYISNTHSGKTRAPSSSFSTQPPNPYYLYLKMCKHEIVGDFYRGCGHFHGRYFTGETLDCGSAHCKTSRAHKHKSAGNCGCMEVVIEERRIQNMFQVPFPQCERITR